MKGLANIMEIVDKDFENRLNKVLENIRLEAEKHGARGAVAYDVLADLIDVLGRSDSLSIKQLIALNDVVDAWS